MIARAMAVGVLTLLTVACASGGTATSPNTVRPDHNLGVGGAPAPGGPGALREPAGPALTLVQEDGTLSVSLDSAGLAVRAVELRLSVEGGATLTLLAHGDGLGPDPLVASQPLDGGLLVALARVGSGPSDPVDGALALLRLEGAGTVRASALALDDALEPLPPITPAQDVRVP